MRARGGGESERASERASARASTRLARRRRRPFSAFLTRPPLISFYPRSPACFRPADERERVKTLLAQEEAANPGLFPCLLRAMRPLMTSAGARAVRDSEGAGVGGAAGAAADEEELEL